MNAVKLFSLLSVFSLLFVQQANAQGWLWAKSAGGSSAEYGTYLTTDRMGNVYVAGSFGSPVLSFGSITLIDSGAVNIFVAKYDSAGNVLWAKSAGGSNNDVAFSITTDGTGNVYITGLFASPTITFGATTLTNFTSGGSEDIFIAKYASTLSTPTIINEPHNLFLYPNPTTGAITLTIDNPVTISAFHVYDMLGRVVYENTNIDPQYCSNSSIHIILPELSDGIYRLLAIGSKNTESLPFVAKK